MDLGFGFGFRLGWHGAFFLFLFGMEFWALQKRMDCIEDHEAHSLCPWEWQNWGSGIEELVLYDHHWGFELAWHESLAPRGLGRETTTRSCWWNRLILNDKLGANASQSFTSPLPF